MTLSSWATLWGNFAKVCTLPKKFTQEVPTLSTKFAKELCSSRSSLKKLVLHPRSLHFTQEIGTLPKKYAQEVHTCPKNWYFAQEVHPRSLPKKFVVNVQQGLMTLLCFRRSQTTLQWCVIDCKQCACPLAWLHYYGWCVHDCVTRSWPSLCIKTKKWTHVCLTNLSEQG